MPDGSNPPPKGGKAALAESLANAEPRKRRRRRDDEPPREPPPIESWYQVPENCPVDCLGIDGKEFLFMDANRQFVKMHHRDFGGQGLASLFGDEQDYLDGAWPRFNQKGEAMGLDKERATRSLMAACARKGVFDSDNKIRGVGAWTDATGRLIWHLGDIVLVVEPDGEWSEHPVGPIGDHVYPQGVVQVRPTVGPFKGEPENAAAMQLYALLQTWAWKRGDLDARLLLGWIGCAMIGGALRWRPAVWATGGNGTGKSTQHDQVLNAVLGGTASVVQTADATGPGLYQALKNRSTPVMFDEIEPDPEARSRVEATIKLAKVSSSGARIVRGSPDGTHKEFVARAAFLFSSILIPRLEPEVAMRICVLDLMALGERKEPKMVQAHMLAIGAALRAMLVNRWADWPERLERWRQAMRAKGFSARVADTWGSLLAMGDHLLSPTAAAEDTHADELDDWIGKLQPYLDALVAAAGSDYSRLLQALMTSPVDPYAKGQKWPLSVLMAVAAQRGAVSDESAGDLDVDKAAAGLEALGIRIMSAKVPPPPEDERPADYKDQYIMAVAVVNDHTALNALLRDNKWTRGVYSQTLLRIPGAWSTQQRVARRKQQCTMIPLDMVVPKPDGGGSDLLTQ